MKNTGKRIDLIANRKPQSQRVLYELRDRLKRNQFILNDTNPDIVISIGGDGMLLSAFHKYENQLDKVRFIGVHTGHLGFYTDYRDFELDKLVTNLQLDTGARVSYPVLNVKVFLENGEVKIFRALNEASIRRSDRTMVADVVINGVHFERFRGDGLTVSTPTGSTAYNKSLGGAVLHPTIEALQLTEIAPTRNDYHTISVDNSVYSFRSIERIEYQIDHHKIHFVATPSHTSFWNRVKDAFIGEVDE
ncbi:MAG: NAD kinase [Streptococcus mitis]|nr:NAD kinase [Streptococcus mitis]